MDLLFLENFVRERSVEETVISEGLSRIPDVTSLPLSFVKQYSAKEQRTYSSPFSWTSEEDYNILKDVYRPFEQLGNCITDVILAMFGKKRYGYILQEIFYNRLDCYKEMRETASENPEFFRVTKLLSRPIHKKLTVWDTHFISVNFSEPHEARKIFKDDPYGILMLKKAMLLDAQRHVWLLLGLAFYASWTLAKDDALNFLRMIVECYQKALDEDPSNEDHLCCLGFAKRVLLLMPIDIEIKRIQAMREFAVSVFPDTEPVEITMDWATMEKKLEWLGRQKCAIFRGWAKENKKMDIATINKKLEELRRQNCAIFEGWAKENKKMEQSNNVVQVGIIVAAVSAMAASLFKKS